MERVSCSYYEHKVDEGYRGNDAERQREREREREYRMDSNAKSWISCQVYMNAAGPT